MPEGMQRLAGALLALAACGGGGDPVARAIGAAVERELGVRPRAVRCARQACTITLPDGAAVEVGIERGDRTVTWRSAELIDPRPIVARVTGELDALGAAQAVDCGALRVAPDGPAVVECRLGGGGTAWATVDAGGAIDVEIAMTAAIAAERRAGPGDDALEALSRALDTDDAEGVESDDDRDDRDLPDASPHAVGL